MSTGKRNGFRLAYDVKGKYWFPSTDVRLYRVVRFGLYESSDHPGTSIIRQIELAGGPASYFQRLLIC
jgi:hypothetical protein